MIATFCRDCANFEERRDIGGFIFCAKNTEPHASRPEFEPKLESANQNRLYNRFCVECNKLDNETGFPLCVKIHTPRVAFDGFKNKIEEPNMTRQSNHMKTSLNTHASSGGAGKGRVPEPIIEIAQRFDWQP